MEDKDAPPEIHRIQTVVTSCCQSNCCKCWKVVFPDGCWNETKVVFKIGAPIILTQLCQILLGPMPLMLYGHLGKMDLDAVALSNSIINVTVISAVEGLGTACDTTFSQVYGSANKDKLGIHVQKSMLVLTLVVLPIWGLHLNTGNLLVLMGEDPEVARITDEYMLIFMPGTLFFFFYIILAKYLQTQNIVYPNCVIGLVANAINVGLYYFFVYYCKMGTKGAALSLDISYFMMLSSTFGYIVMSGAYKDTWDGLDWDCLSEWSMFAKLALFGYFMICFEWWSFEICVFVAGTLGNTQLGAMSITYQFEEVWFMFPYGASVATSIVVGQYLGGGKKRNARAAGWSAMITMSAVSCFFAMVFLTLRNYLPLLFTNIPEVVALTSEVLPILGAFSLVDTLTGVGAGVLRGCGKQSLGTLVIGVFYTFALTIGIPVMLSTNQGIIVMWLALVIAVAVEASLFLLCILAINWDQEILRAAERTKIEEEIVREFERKMSLVDERRQSLTNAKRRASLFEPDEMDPLMENGQTIKYTADMPPFPLISEYVPEGKKMLPLRCIIFFIFFLFFLTGLICRLLIPQLYDEKREEPIVLINSTAKHV